MYNDYFLLRESPFSITPDPRYLYLSERHADALAHLLYGINEAGGFIQLTGEVGTGKTTLVRALLERLPNHTEVAAILNPRVAPIELLQSICDELRIVVPNKSSASPKELIDLLNEHLLMAHTKGHRVVVVLDEAQNLSEATLEQVRLLTNLETSRRKLLQIILVGQPELREVLAHNNLRQLAQRITGRFHLGALSRRNTSAYIRHRLHVAGATTDLFSSGAMNEVYRLSGGIPRVVNVICDRALLGAYTQEDRIVDAALVRRAAGEVYGKTYLSRWVLWAATAAAVFAAVSIVLVAWHLTHSVPEAAIVEVANTAPANVAIEAAPPPTTPLQDVQTFLTELNSAQAGQEPIADDSTVAFATLFQLWGVRFDANGARPCDQATEQGLQCVYQKGSWGQLRLLNRPAILSINLADGGTRQVALTALDTDSAQLTAGTHEARVSLLSLSRDWLGEYLVLWRPPSPLQREMSIGMRGNEVRWLRNGLDQVAGRAASQVVHTNVSDVYDRELADRVGAFQRIHRLNVDGIAGLQTQIVLDNLLDNAIDASATPRLVSRTPSEDPS